MASSPISREDRLREFQREELALARKSMGHVFWPGSVPRIVWRDANRVRELVGAVAMQVRWFDADLNEMPTPDKPGRYAAYIEGKMRDGTLVRRAMSFYAQPPELNFWVSWDLPVPYLGGPIDPNVWEEQSDFVCKQAGRLYRDSLRRDEAGAVLLAGLTETKPGDWESPDVLNDDFQLALKLKLAGLAEDVRPLAPARLRSGDAAPVLREGTASEAGVTPDAKARIDALCREWAEESGEPFTTLVARRGVVVTHEAFGKTPGGDPVDLDYRTDVASITKAVTGMLFSLFLDQGYVELDDSIGRQIPGFPTTGEQALTYRHLFTHTCSLESHGEWGGMHNPYLDNVILNGIDYIHPGQVHMYNGMGYDLAGKAMEYMTGKSVIRLMHESLLHPLGISRVPLDDLAYGAHLTSWELGVLGQWLANHGSYGEKEFISEDTFQQLLPEPLGNYYPGVDPEWGIGLVHFRDQKPDTPPNSKDPDDLILGEHVIGHGSSSNCILRVDLDHDLVITQIRRQGGAKYDEYVEKLLLAVRECLV